jgi:hypothetical protein|tara:strand:+ start:264 stop:704 length:441 start_codon:yes stop_codon:yes gene_type:complete
MKQEENIKLTGNLTIVLNRENGTKDVYEHKNLVVTTGKNFIASRMKDTTDAAMSHMAIGSGNTAAAAGDTALGTQLDIQSLTSTTVSTNTVTYAATFGAGNGTGAVAEAGVFNASSSGTMLCRSVFSVVNKAAGDSMTVTWVITIS